MKNKQCATCKIQKDISLFTRNRSKKDGLNHSCSECHKKYTQRHYQKNKQKYLEKARKNDAQYREKIDKFIQSLKNKPCLDCGKTFPSVAMDFDHIKGKKINNISTMRAKGWSLKKIREEIEKCELVCSNCHRIRTHQRKPTPKYKEGKHYE